MSGEEASKYLEGISKSLLEAKTFYEMWYLLRDLKSSQYMDIIDAYVQ